MHHELWNPPNLPQGEKGRHQSSAISTELSLTSSTFQSTCNRGGITRTHYPSGNSKRNRTKTWRPNGRNNPKKICSNNKERKHWGCSTALELYDNPWKIKKVLTTSDLGKLNRLLFGEDLVENLMLPVLGADAQRDAGTGMGTPIRVWDVDTKSMHSLILKRWASFKNYVLIGKWSQDFVRRRELKKGDEIGLQWDSCGHCFNFSVLKRNDDEYFPNPVTLSHFSPPLVIATQNPSRRHLPPSRSQHAFSSLHLGSRFVIPARCSRSKPALPSLPASPPRRSPSRWSPAAATSVDRSD